MFDEKPFIDDVQTIGSGEIPVLVVPGMLSSREDYEKLAQQLPDRTFHVAMNPYIHGSRPIETNVDAMNAAWLDGIREQMLNIEPVEMAGHSKGVLDVLHAIQHQKRSSVEKVILLNPPTKSNAVEINKDTKLHPRPEKNKELLVYASLALLTAEIDQDEFARMCEEHEAEYGKKITKILQIIKQARIDMEGLRSIVEQLTLPTLVVAGDKDPMNHATTLESVFGNVSNVQVQTVEGGDHFIQRSRPKQVATLWQKWASAQ